MEGQNKPKYPFLGGGQKEPTWVTLYEMKDYASETNNKTPKAKHYLPWLRPLWGALNPHTSTKRTNNL